jgi:NADH-quinone oxidoreductase subunit I
MRLMEIIKGAYSLMKGMKVTIKAFFGPAVTCQYPRETLIISERFRGHIKLLSDKCRACGLCERSCPTNCIKVEGEKREEQKHKVVTRFILDFTRCSHCGLCVENCPQGAIGFSRDYNLASLRKEDFVFDLLLEYKKRGAWLERPSFGS